MPRLSRQQLDNLVEKVIHTTPPDAYLSVEDQLLITTHKGFSHWYAPGKLQHIVWRTADSIPQCEARPLLQYIETFKETHPEPWDQRIRYQLENKIGKRINQILDRGYGKCHLRSKECRQILIDTLLYSIPPEHMEMISYVIMPNHIHILARCYTPLEDLLEEIKSKSGISINRLVGMSGSFWHHGYYDRMLRNDTHLRNVMYYIVNNPRHIAKNEYSLWIKDVGFLDWCPEYYDKR